MNFLKPTEELGRGSRPGARRIRDRYVIRPIRLHPPRFGGASPLNLNLRDDMQGDEHEAERLRVEAKNCERRAEEHAEDNPMYSEHLYRRAVHCRRLARDEDTFNGEDS